MGAGIRDLHLRTGGKGRNSRTAPGLLTVVVVYKNRRVEAWVTPGCRGELVRVMAAPGFSGSRVTPSILSRLEGGMIGAADAKDGACPQPLP